MITISPPDRVSVLYVMAALVLALAGMSCSEGSRQTHTAPPMDEQTIKVLTEDLLNVPILDKAEMAKSLEVPVDDSMVEAQKAELRRAIEAADKWFETADEHLEFAKQEEKALRFNSAILHYGRALQKNPARPETYAAIAMLKNSQGKPDDAIRMYDAALKLTPDRPGWLLGRGDILYNRERTREAIADFESAIALKPDFAKAYASLAVAQWRLKEYDAAWDAVEKCKRNGGEIRADFELRLAEDSGRPLPPMQENSDEIVVDESH